ncbi:MAG: hypothetical protein SFX73_29745 [Kofleriaceae bacterium]|nr:hypothetical protein [Kofleriaceae bacterium]
MASSTTAALRGVWGAPTGEVYAIGEHGRELVYTLTPAVAGTVTLTLDAAVDLDVIVLASGAGGGCEPRNPGCVAASSTAGGDEVVSFAAAACAT